MDDPIRGPPESTLPIELFRTNPYLLLLCTNYGGHCGFLTDSPVAWSHEVTLDFFRSVTEFFRIEEKTKWLANRRNSNIMSRRRRPTLQRRELSAYRDLEEEIFSWKRSYTRWPHLNRLNTLNNIYITHEEKGSLSSMQKHQQILFHLFSLSWQKPCTSLRKITIWLLFVYIYPTYLKVNKRKTQPEQVFGHAIVSNFRNKSVTKVCVRVRLPSLPCNAEAKLPSL